jgi:hypothetical protein
MKALILDDIALQAIAAVRKHAEQHVISRQTLMRTLAGREAPIGDKPEYAVYIKDACGGAAYRCVYSQEDQPKGRCHHLSVSVDDDGESSPQLPVVGMIAKEFGMEDKLSDPDISLIWVEEVPGDPGEKPLHAVNVLQVVKQ